MRAPRPSPLTAGVSRRDILRRGMFGIGLVVGGSVVYSCGGKEPNRAASNLANFGPLAAADQNGLRLPPGFSGRVVARSGAAPVPTSSYLWHGRPAGGATFETEDGGWIYVSNSDLEPGAGGVGALRFDSEGTAIGAYSILFGSAHNCSGGATPWGTWLSCEKATIGQVWECDPIGVRPAVLRPALGTFRHTAVAVDPIQGHLYLTEDEVDGRFYRYVPLGDPAGDRLDLDDGRLEVARLIGDGPSGPVEWLPVPDPTFMGEVATRYQVPASTPFPGGKGIWYGNHVMYFTTKFDNRVWIYDIDSARVEILYDDDTSENPILSGVDDVTVSAQGDVLVAEDGGDMQIVGFAPTGEIVPIVQIEGHQASEVAGPAFDPSGTRLYFSSQRGAGDPPSGGVTYEISGPFST